MATVTLISRQTVSNTSSITFNSLGSYQDLRLIATVNSATAGNFNGQLALRFNSDSGNNYSRTMMGNENANLWTQQQNTGLNGLLLANGYASADNNSANRCIAEVYIPQYGNSVSKKSILVQSWGGGYNDSGGGVYNYSMMLAGQWDSTNAITSLTVYTTAGTNMTAGFISLYGIE